MRGFLYLLCSECLRRAQAFVYHCVYLDILIHKTVPQMPRLTAKPLTDLQVRTAKPKEGGSRTLSDGNGLYLRVSSSGRKSWLLRYTLPGSGNATPAVIGEFPAMSLADARLKAFEARKSAQAGEAILGVRKARNLAEASAQAEEQAANEAELDAKRATLRSVAQRWLDETRPRWALQTYKKAHLVVKDYFVPALGDMDMRTLTTKDVRPVLVEMGHKVPTVDFRLKLSRVFHRKLSHRFAGQLSSMGA
jgi:hypothetical protein